MVPSRLFVLILVVPFGLAALTLLDRSLLPLVLAVDGLIGFVVLIDAWLSRGVVVSVKRQAPEVLSLGRPNRVRILARSHAARPLVVEVTEDLFDGVTAPDLPVKIALPGHADVESHYDLYPSRRGAYELERLSVRYPSVLGFWLRQVRFPERHAVRVYPDLKHIRTFELMARQNREYALVRATRMRGGESEFSRLREYSRDDDYRAIDWKATARRQKLTAREYQLESNQNVLFMVDAGRMMTAEVESLSRFDHALNAALMLAHIAARGGDKVGLLGFDDQVRVFVPPEAGPLASRRLIQASYHLYPRLVEPDYDLAFTRLATRARQRSLIVLFTHVVDDAVAHGLLRHTKRLLKHHLPLIILFRDVDIERLVDPWQREDRDVYTQAAAAELLRWRQGVALGLKRAGALVLDVAPRELTGALINSYLEIKARHRL